MASSRLLKALAVALHISAREVTGDVALEMAEDLSDYPEDKVIDALTRARREVKYITLADVVSRIDDGRPGVEEAWAMIPKSEADSVVWTTEIRDAYAAARPLIDQDPIAARMTFREVYSKLLANSRASKTTPKWEPSLGHDKSKQELALHRAVELQRISADHANSLLPDLRMPTDRARLTGPSEGSGLVGVHENIQSIMERVTEGASTRVKLMAKRPLDLPEPEPESAEEKRQRYLSQLDRLSEPESTDAESKPASGDANEMGN